MSDKSQMKEGPRVSVLDRALQILHLEDSLADRELIQHWLKEQNIAAEFTEVDNEQDFLKAIHQKPFDIILSDKSLPGFDGMAALRFVRERFPNIPFVFVTGSMGEEAAIDTIKDGATDYVLKNRLSRLIPAVQRAIRESEHEEKNRQNEEKFHQQAALLDKAQDAIMVKDMTDRILYWNKGAERIYGWASADMIGRKAAAVLSTDAARYAAAEAVLLEKGSWIGELTKLNRGGNPLTVQARWNLVRDDAGNPKSVFVIDTDITEKKALEAKFLRSQRMDSIGALASGIAHDLNNALAPVILSAEFLGTCESAADRQKFLDIILSNAQRATDLVKQILSFARGSGSRREPVPLTRLIGDMGKMIQDTFPKSILFSVHLPDAGLWTLQGDSTEVHQVLLNLCVNARDAMPAGGKLNLSVQNFTLDADTANATETKPGSYILISVADSGTGIPPEVLPRIFEPFFTTKLGDKGTGLGLSTAAGIVKHHGGFMDIQTDAGKGTTFHVYFPAITSVEKIAAKAREVVLPTGQGELILVIDDEETVLELTKTTLESYGYMVVTAQNGLEGIAKFRETPDEIQLVVTDTDMPHLDGLGAIRAITLLRPDIRTILVSGAKRDTEELQRQSLHLKKLQKPFTLDQLLMAVAGELRENKK